MSSCRMSLERNLTIGAVAIYAVLIFAYFAKVEVFLHSDRYCNSFSSACVSFCCQNKETCSKEFVRDNFDQSIIPGYDPNDFWSTNETYEFIPVLSGPNCLLIPEERPWQFTQVSIV